MGTQLAARGVPTPLPGWSVHAIERAADTLAAIHRDYADAGATVHTANTFRTRPRTAGPAWAGLAREAVRICRSAVPERHRVAGAIAPLEDCYRPDLSPSNPGPEHLALAEALAEAGCDLILCETFPHPGEAVAAVEAARSTGLETWVSLTAGPEADLMSPDELVEAARACVARGASTVLVNCVAASRTLPYVQALSVLRDRVPIGAYANAGHPDERIGWQSGPPGPEVYAELARTWIAAGATRIGGCCGTGPEHIRAIARVLE